jgi:hypothetical protein
MVDTYGRPITLVNDKGAASSSDPLGPAAAPVTVPDIMGVFVRPSGYIKLGESFYLDPGMWQEAEKIVLVLPSLTHDFAKFTRVIDEDNLGYKIFKVEELRPGNVPILLYLGLRQ